MSGGCAENDVSFSISRFIPPTLMAAGGACVFDPAVIVNQTRGQWDVDVAKFFPIGYNANFVLENHTASAVVGGVEVQAVYVSSFDVILEPQGAVADAIPPARREFNFLSGSIRVAPSSQATAYVEAIAPDLTAAIAALPGDVLGLVSVKVRAVITRGEAQTVSAYSSFPVEICKGCLSNSTAGTFPSCYFPMGTIVHTGNPCNPAADQAVDCCTPDGNKSLICGTAAVATM